MKKGKGVVILRNEKPGARLKRLKRSLESVREAEREIARKRTERKPLTLTLKRAIANAEEEVAVEEGIRSWLQDTEPESWTLAVVDRSTNRETFRLSGIRPFGSASSVFVANKHLSTTTNS
jgi:hypothetical protein